MSIVLPKPKSITIDEVVLHRNDWERLVALVGEADADEDQDDIAAVEAARADEAKLGGRRSAERIERTIPLEVIKAELGGAHPVKAWRNYRGLTQLRLASDAGIKRVELARIEAGREKGSDRLLEQLARVLRVPADVLSDDE